MQKAEYKNIFESEARHFYYVANHELILSLIKTYLERKKGKRTILDAGCGTGLLAKRLEQFGDVSGIDTSPEALKFSAQRGVNVDRASITKIPFPDNSFDLITCIDVLYHKGVQNDRRALKELFRVLKHRGLLVLRVPAHRWLTTAHDRYVHTGRRYSKSELEAKLTLVGFTILKLSFINMGLFPLALVRHFFEKIHPPHKIASGVTMPVSSLNNALGKILGFEAYLLQRVNLPLGVGLLAVCKKLDQ